MQPRGLLLLSIDMGAPSKRAQKIRARGEFDAARLRTEIGAPYANYGGFAWSLPDIYAARDQQMLGRFSRAARLAESTRTDSAIFAARQNRLAPQRCIAVGLVPAKGARGERIAAEAEATFGAKGVGITPDTQADINGYLADHGVAFGYCHCVPRADGSRIDMTVRAWPIEFVWWDENERVFKTTTREGGEERIVNGDGRWIVFQSHEVTPWKNGALIATALVWAIHAFGSRDWSKSSAAHGNAKVMGEMPVQVPLQDAEGKLTPEAAAFLEVLKGIASGDMPVGIRPSGAKTEYLTNGSNAWQVFQSLSEGSEKAANRIYCGTDGALGAQGGAPGVDIKALLGVGQTIYSGDFLAMERGFTTAIEVWTALNFGDSTLAPTRKFLVPDGDEDARAASYATRKAAFYDDVDRAKKSGFVVDAAFVSAIAALHQIEPPLLPELTSSSAPTIVLAPTDLASVVTVNEARASAGVSALLLADGSPDPDGSLTIERFRAKQAATAAGASSPTPAASSEVVGTLGRLADALSRVETIRGRDGADGRDGKDGRDGADGREGAPGGPGPAGPQGSEGPKGRDAEELALSFAQRSAAFLEDVETTRRVTGRNMSPKAFAELARAHGVDPEIYAGGE